MKIKTPYYLIDETKLLKNLKRIEHLKKVSGAKTVLALKCFSTWAVFPLMKKYMDGTTSSSLFETRLGYEKFGGETHSYCVGYSDSDIPEIIKYSDKIIFNSQTQLKKYYNLVKEKNLGIRINPGISYSHFGLADPARKHSRLGVAGINSIKEVLPFVKGFMFHYNCENADFTNFSKNLDYISKKYGSMLKQIEWVSLGGGFYFTRDGYPIDKFAKTLKTFSDKFGVQVYLEPGETAITRAAELVTTVVDVIKNKKDIAVVDASTEAHMLDLLIYNTPAKMDYSGGHNYIIAGRSCLAGDIFGQSRFPKKLKPGDTIRIADAAGYTMVKKNWFNGLQMPSIAIKKIDGSVKLQRSFNYSDFIGSLS